MSAEESENEPKLRVEALLGRRRRGTMGEPEAALTRAFMVLRRYCNMIDRKEDEQCRHKRTRYMYVWHFSFGARVASNQAAFRDADTGRFRRLNLQKCMQNFFAEKIGGQTRGDCSF